MRNIFIITTALMLTTVPAHAQLLGGGGLGGGLGGALGGSLNGTIGGTLGGASSVGSTVDSVRSSTSGTLRSAGSTSGSQSVNRKSGAVHADRSASAAGGGDIAQTVATPTRMIGGDASGHASGSGSGNLDAQLLGTDAVRSTASSARGTAGGTSGGALSMTGGLTGSLTGTLSGSGSASGSGGGTGALGPIGGDGEAGGSGQGGFQVTRGMPVLAPDGERIGKVRQLFTNGRGEIQQMLVKVGDSTALLPATNFSASGNAVMSAMTQGQIQQAAQQQGDGSGSNK
ncbi:hypothetical protein [Novosphingobium colocasiae]|uniref:hypothetical protein n=1 Tax=Novosphingobium colocasiae TaxID=1256513 RepID=UPI0035B4E670